MYIHEILDISSPKKKKIYILNPWVTILTKPHVKTKKKDDIIKADLRRFNKRDDRLYSLDEPINKDNILRP